MKTFRLIPAAAVAFSMMCALTAGGAHAQADVPRTRAEVMAEVHAARAAGTLGVFTGEDGGSFHLSRQASQSRPRATVVAELAQWRDSGAMAIDRAEFEGLITQGSTLPPSTLTRAEVQAQLFAARETGELSAFAGEDSGSFYLAQLGDMRAATALAAARAPRLGTLVAAQQLSQMCASPAAGDAQMQLARLYAR